MKPIALYEDIRTYCQANADEAIVKKYARFFKEGYDAYGLGDNLLKDKVAQILSNKNVNLDLIREASEFLIKSGKYEETFFAILLLKSFADEFKADIFDDVTHWFEIGIHNWAHCDVLCRDLTSILLKNKIVELHAFEPWRTAAHKFQRRAVPVTLIEILKNRTKYKSLYDFIGPLMLDPERVVHQGVGWFLREIWKLNREETESFLLKWKNEAPRLIYQYATEKMTKEEKQRFKKEKMK